MYSIFHYFMIVVALSTLLYVDHHFLLTNRYSKKDIVISSFILGFCLTSIYTTILLIVYLISLYFLFKYRLRNITKYQEKFLGKYNKMLNTLELDKNELDLPKELEMYVSKFNTEDLNIAFCKQKNKNKKGFYYDYSKDLFLFNTVNNINELKSVFTHEYCHYISKKYQGDLEYFGKKTTLLEEQGTDILAYFLSKEKGLDYNIFTYIKKEIVVKGNYSNSLKRDIEKLLLFEKELSRHVIS